MLVDRQDFNPLIGEKHHTYMLPQDQIKEINSLPEQRDKIIVGIQWNKKNNVVKVLTGSFATITIPCSRFPLDENGNQLDFENPSLGDYGFDVFIGRVKIDLGDVLFNFNESKT